MPSLYLSMMYDYSLRVYTYDNYRYFELCADFHLNTYIHTHLSFIVDTPQTDQFIDEQTNRKVNRKKT